ncbi:MAG: glycoside hydrolase family 127 protein, partial [Verrucomicrobiae bacterium]|nr:glycoside hydrolase family 127 protein [Verrucomicrobiae bacterium]
MNAQTNPHQMQRRCFIARLMAGTAAISSIAHARTPKAPPQPRSKRTATPQLAAPALRPMPLGSIKPRGWLQRQLRIQAEGLSGHLDEFWPDISQSQWFGGKADGWERAPYWLDGVIPLAWALDDDTLKAKVQRYVEYIVRAQRPDGWYSVYPQGTAARTYDLWAILLVNKALVQYHEATSDSSVLLAVLRNLRTLNESLDHTPLFNWGRFRWFEGLIPTYYAYEQTREKWLLELARKLHQQGFDYASFYTTEDVTQPTPRRGLWRWDKHVVNTGMALKAYA